MAPGGLRAQGLLLRRSPVKRSGPAPVRRRGTGPAGAPSFPGTAPNVLWTCPPRTRWKRPPSRGKLELRALRPMVGIDGRDVEDTAWPDARWTTVNLRAAGAGAAAKAVLSIAGATGETRGVALVLHGGRADSYESVRGRHLSPARMLPFARALQRGGGTRRAGRLDAPEPVPGLEREGHVPRAGRPLGPLPHQPRTPRRPRLSPRPLDGRPDRALRRGPPAGGSRRRPRALAQRRNPGGAAWPAAGS